MTSRQSSLKDLSTSYSTCVVPVIKDTLPVLSCILVLFLKGPLMWRALYNFEEVLFYMVQNWFNDEVGVCSIVHQYTTFRHVSDLTGTFVLNDETIECHRKTLKTSFRSEREE